MAASAFRDVRAAPPSDGKRAYLGLGENAPIGTATPGASSTRAALAAGEKCLWSPNIWANPIKADELRGAAARFGEGARVLTGAAFTDNAIAALPDLSEYRILHFATHGLVTAPQPQCPPRPALLTSFDSEAGSDGLLSFAEIFGLRIDADLVILSACDTAGSATVGATREAGGGESEAWLDGVRRAIAETALNAGATAAETTAIVDEAFALAFEQSSEAWEAVLDSRQDTRAGGLDALVSHYFRQRPAEKSCPILAFSSRTSHLPAASRTVGVYGRGTERLLERFRAEAGHTARPTGTEPDALVLFAAMVGTGLLMRAAGDTPWVRAMQDAVLAALPRPAATDTAGVAP